MGEDGERDSGGEGGLVERVEHFEWRIVDRVSVVEYLDSYLDGVAFIQVVLDVLHFVTSLAFANTKAHHPQ